MIGPLSRLDRAQVHEETIITREDIGALRAAAQPKKGSRQPPPYSDALLSYVGNAEMCSTVSLAWCLDPYDQDLRDQQELFKESYTKFRAAIAGLSNDSLRMSVELPANYVRSIEDNWLLEYAQPRDSDGRPREWRKDEFYIRVLTLYQLFSGKKPAPSEGGPTVRFMRAIESILHRFLASVSVRSRDERIRELELLWRMPANDSFLREWFRSKTQQGLDVLSQVNTFAEMGVKAYANANAYVSDCQRKASQPQRDVRGKIKTPTVG